MDESKKVDIDFSAFKPYYQQEFSKITYSNGMYRGKFNFCACIFNWMWLLSKGLIVQGLALLALCLAVIFFMGFSNIDEDWIPIILPLMGILVCLIMGIKGNYIYYKSVVLRLTK